MSPRRVCREWDPTSRRSAHDGSACWSRTPARGTSDRRRWSSRRATRRHRRGEPIEELGQGRALAVRARRCGAATRRSAASSRPSDCRSAGRAAAQAELPQAAAHRAPQQAEHPVLPGAAAGGASATATTATASASATATCRRTLPLSDRETLQRSRGRRRHRLVEHQPTRLLTGVGVDLQRVRDSPR